MVNTASSVSDVVLRPATAFDLRAIMAIYNEVIATTTAVFREEPVDLTERRSWFAIKAERRFPVLVADREGDVLAFATIGGFRPWPCYNRTAEHSVHVRGDARRLGIGRRLISELESEAVELGFHVMVAGIDADNTASIDLHRKLGFFEAGTLRQVGRKFGRWLDLAFLQKILPSDTPSAGRHV